MTRGDWARSILTPFPVLYSSEFIEVIVTTKLRYLQRLSINEAVKIEFFMK